MEVLIYGIVFLANRLVGGCKIYPSKRNVDLNAGESFLPVHLGSTDTDKRKPSSKLVTPQRLNICNRSLKDRGSILILAKHTTGIPGD